MTDQVKKEVTVGVEDLKSILQTVIEEARKPLPPTAQEQAKLDQLQALRAQQSGLVKQNAENRRQRRQMCTHTRRDGSIRAVFVNDDLGGYMICQECQDRVRPEISQKLRETDAAGTHYDTVLFNKLFQASAPTLFA